MFVSIHIPKTAGTSLGDVFDYSSGRRVFWDYDPSYRYTVEVQPEIKKGIDFISSYYKFIHGHFYFQKYENIIPGAKFISCVRHPVDRVISQYLHEAYETQVDSWQSKLIREGEMDVVEYCKSDANISAAMTNHLSGCRVEDYDFIFVTESLAGDLADFSKKFNFPIMVPLPVSNKGSYRQVEAVSTSGSMLVKQVTEEQRKRVFEICNEDVALYSKCEELRLIRMKNR